MSVDVICPECGGVIGGDASSQQACTCDNGDVAGGTSVTADADERIHAAADAGRTEKKVCLQCGKDLRGHRRVKSSAGYTCYHCYKANRRAELEGTIKCSLCKRRLKPGGLVHYNGRMVCKRCYEDAKNEKRMQAVDSKSFHDHEKKKTIVLAVVFIVLLIFILISIFT